MQKHLLMKKKKLKTKDKKGAYILNNKPLEKKIEKLEQLKNKELEKIAALNQTISEYDKQLKVLYDFRKEQERIYQRQQELDLKIKEQQ